MISNSSPGERRSVSRVYSHGMSQARPGYRFIHLGKCKARVRLSQEDTRPKLTKHLQSPRSFHRPEGQYSSVSVRSYRVCQSLPVYAIETIANSRLEGLPNRGVNAREARPNDDNLHRTLILYWCILQGEGNIPVLVRN